MATNLRRLLVCVAAMLLISDGWTMVNAAEDNSGTTPDPTTNPTTAAQTTQVTTGGTATSTEAVTDTTEAVTMGTNTGATMMTGTSTFDTTEMVTGMTTGAAPATVPPHGEWTIRDSSDKVCMKIQFGGTYSVDGDVTVIPRDGITKASSCSDDKAIFNLIDSEEETTFNMTLKFEHNGDTYEMNSIIFTIVVVQLPLINTYNGDHSKEYFTAPVGKFYTCAKELKEPFYLKETVTLTLTDQKYQPFAQTSGGDYGKAFNCGDKLPEDDHGPRVGLIVSMTLLAILVVAGCGFFVYRRRKTSYHRFDNP